MKTTFYYILILSSVFTLGSCSNKDKKADSTSIEREKKDAGLVTITPEQFKSMNMEISNIEEKDFNKTIKASGKVDVPPNSKAKVTSFVGGYVKTIPLLVGSKVSKGQPLLMLESPDYIDLQQSYLEIAGQMEYLKSEYERQKTLFNEKISSQKKYLEAESEYKRAKATYQSLRQKLTMLNINPTQVEQGKFASQITVYSPISGNITVINTNLGMTVLPTDIVMEIVEDKDMYLDLSVFEKDAFLLKNGQTVEFTVPLVGSEVFNAKVTQIGKSIEGNERIVNVYASLSPETKQKLLTGMFVDAKLIADTKKGLSIPVDAITTEESNKFILILESKNDNGYQFRKTLIETGERNGDWIEVIPTDKINSATKYLSKGAYDAL